MPMLVSVIIPVYNGARFLPGCMASVLGQSYPDLDVILVDDGSDDGSGELCDHYAAADRRVRVIHRINGGLSVARNSGIGAALGDYITFVDGDDVIAEDMIGHMVQLAEEHDADLVEIMLKRETSTEACAPTLGPFETLDSLTALRRIYTMPPYWISACGKLYRRALFDGVRFPAGYYYEDEYTTPRLYIAARKIVHSKSPLYFYMQWDNESIMRGDLNGKKIADSLEIVEDRLRLFGELGDKKLLRKAKIDCLLKYRSLYAKTADGRFWEQHRRICEKKRKFAMHHPGIAGYVGLRSCISSLKHQFFGR